MTIQIQTFENGEVIQRDAKAYQTVEPGLVVNRDSARGGKWLPTWAVTHRVSGYRVVGGFRSLHAAREYAAEIAGVTDWTEDRTTLLARSEEVVPKLRLMTQRFKGRGLRMATARTLTMEQLIPETYWGRLMERHPNAARCPNCGDDLLKIGVTKLAYSMELCKCKRAPYTHLVEQLWHRHCFIDQDGKLPGDDGGY